MSSSSSSLARILEQAGNDYSLVRFQEEGRNTSILCVVDRACVNLLPNPSDLLPSLDPTFSSSHIHIVNDEQKGQCLISGSSIPQGNAIFAERPLYILPQALERDEEVQVAVVEELPEIHSAFYKLDVSSGAEGQDIIQSIYDTNSHSLSIGDRPHSGIFSLSSRISHSCSPNAIQRFDLKTMSLQLYALKSIAEGTEITIAYYPLDVLLLQRDARRLAIHHHRGFDCACETCSLPDKEATCSNSIRAEILRLSQQLFAKDAHGLEDIRTVHLTLALHDREGLVTGKATLYQIGIRIYRENGLSPSEAFVQQAMREISVRYGSQSSQMQELQATMLST